MRSPSAQVIITTNSVLVMNPEDENVLPFITELKMKLSQPSGLAGVGGSFPSALNDLANGKSAVMPTRSAAKLENLAALEMPFELRALEVCLDSVSDKLDVWTREIQHVASMLAIRVFVAYCTAVHPSCCNMTAWVPHTILGMGCVSWVWGVSPWSHTTAGWMHCMLWGCGVCTACQAPMWCLACLCMPAVYGLLVLVLCLCWC